MPDNTVVIHVLRSGLTIPGETVYSGFVAYQNQTITLSPEQVERTRDRHGRSWLDMSDDEQRERWGEIRFARGPAPEDAVIGADDTEGLVYRRYQRDLEYAKRISDPAERAAALAKLKADHPERQRQSQWSLGSYGG